MQTQGKEVAVKKAAVPALPEHSASWGTESIVKNELPNVYLAVNKDNGEIMRTDTKEVLGGLGRPVKVIAFKHVREWQLIDIADGKTHDRKVRYERDGISQGDQVFKQGQELQWYPAHMMFFLLAGREHEGVFIYSGRKTSKWAIEKTLLKSIDADATLGKPIASHIYLFSSELKVNDKKQKYHVCNFQKDAPSSEEQLATAYKLWSELNKSEAKLKEAMSENDANESA